MCDSEKGRAICLNCAVTYIHSVSRKTGSFTSRRPRVKLQNSYGKKNASAGWVDLGRLIDLGAIARASCLVKRLGRWAVRVGCIASEISPVDGGGILRSNGGHEAGKCEDSDMCIQGWRGKRLIARQVVPTVVTMQISPWDQPGSRRTSAIHQGGVVSGSTSC